MQKKSTAKEGGRNNRLRGGSTTASRETTDFFVCEREKKIFLTHPSIPFPHIRREIQGRNCDNHFYVHYWVVSLFPVLLLLWSWPCLDGSETSTQKNGIVSWTLHKI